MPILVACAGPTPGSPLNYMLDLDALRGIKTNKQPLRVELTPDALRRLKTILEGLDV